MAYRYKIKFGPLGGHMLYRNQRPVLLGMLATARERFTDLERVKMAGHMQSTSTASQARLLRFHGLTGSSTAL